MPNLSPSSPVASIVAQQPPQGMGMNFMLVMGLMLAAMYFFTIAPQRKKEKEHKKLLESITSGDEILTTGGIYGTVTNTKPDRIVLRIADNTKIELSRTFIHSVVKKADAPAS